ncbi:MAG: oligosaccharide flippase family protein [Sedimenticola sp.]
MSIGNKALTAGIWLGSFSYAKQAFSFIAQIVLARFLMPEDFGQYALMSSVLELLLILVNIASADGIVKFQTEDDILPTAWKITVYLVFGVLALATIGLFIALAAGVSDQVVALLFILTLSRLMRLPASVQEVWVEKDLKYRLVSATIFASTIVGASAGVIAAVSDFGVWSLIIKELFESATFIILMQNLSKVDRRGRFNSATARKLLRYGYELIGSRLMDVLSARLPVILLGFGWSLQVTGYFERGYYLSDVQNTAISPIANRVIRSVYGKIQFSIDKVSEALYWHLFVTLRWSLPVALFLFVSGNEFVVLLFGEQWHVVGDIVVALSLWIAFHSSCVAMEVCIKTVDTPFAMTISKTIGVFGVIVGFVIGIQYDQWLYVAVGYSVSVLLRALFLVYYLKRKLEITVDWFGCLSKPLVTVGLLFSAFVYFSDVLTQWWLVGLLIVSAWILMLLVFERRSLRELAARLGVNVNPILG